MRKTFNLLFICLIALYGWIGYQVIHTTDLPQCQPEGSLSDVAEEVIAIPLKTNGHCSLNKIKMIKRDREDIFLVSDRQLYHFNSSGQFLGQITAHLPGTRQPVELVDYAVDPVHNRLVVIGTGHEVYYYDYDGQLLFQSTKADGIVNAQLVENLCFPLSLKHQKQRRDRAVAQIGDDSLLDIAQIFLICHDMIHLDSSCL